MDELRATETSLRLRANWGRRLRPDFVLRIEQAFGYQPEPADFLDLTASDGLEQEWLARWRDLRPLLTWPESQQPAVFDHLRRLADHVSETHSSYMLFFENWECLGALGVRSRVVLASAQEFWRQGSEPVCLLTTDLRDGIFLDYTEPKQMLGDDEYELFAWGAFASSQ